MSRSPTAGVAGQLSNTVVQNGYLVQITVSTIPVATNLYLTSLDTDFNFNSLVWTSTDIGLKGINWQPGGIGPGTMVLGDSELIWWGYTLNLLLQDVPVSIWQCYADAPGEAEPLWTGRIGLAQRGNQSVTFNLVPDNQTRLVPFKRVQSIAPANVLMAAGTVINIASQQWILQAKTWA